MKIVLPFFILLSFFSQNVIGQISCYHDEWDELTTSPEIKKPVNGNINVAKVAPAVSSFKNAVLAVFKSYRESNLSSIKSTLRNGSNFWNYKYTYSTNLKIPGEKFNMLYSFPFVNSPVDFVSVIKEADAYDASFLVAYKEFEKKLTHDFPPGEGWVASCIKNKEAKELSDLEFSNDKYGAVVLDYSKSPKGKYILYLRFLLYSN